MLPVRLRSLKRCNVLCTLLKLNKLKTSYVRSASNIIRCDLPDINIPTVTLPDFIFQDFSKFPHKTAMVCAETGRQYSYEEVRQKAINLNKALRKKFKLNKDDIVAIFLPNIPEYAICVLGILLANLRVTTVNPFGTAEETKRQLLDTDAKGIFTTCQLASFIVSIVQQLPSRIPVITIKTQVSDTAPKGLINFQELVDTICDIDDVSACSTHDIAVLPYSSGTTGTHKGVLHSHNTLIANTCQMKSKELHPIEETSENFQETTPAILPFFHIYGLTILLLLQLYNLVKIVTIPKFTTTIFLDTLIKHKPKNVCIVPPIALFLANHSSVKKEHFESLERLYCGAAPLGAIDEDKLVKRSEKNVKICQGYGLTESPVATAHYRNRGIPPGSVGRPTQNTELKVVPVDNPFGEALGCNQPGELLIKGPQVMLGYYNRPKETADSFIDGWFKSGDLVYYDEYNNFFVKDRLKELIKVKGYQVPPAELEELLRSYPTIADAVVIGIPHEKYGEVPRAYITAKDGMKIDIKELDEFVSSKVAKYKKIVGGFALVDTIPKTPSGKYLRKDLKLQYMQEQK